MKQATITALLRAYNDLQEVAANLYLAAQEAFDSDDYDDYALLSSRGDKIFEESQNIDILIVEMQADENR